MENQEKRSGLTKKLALAGKYLLRAAGLILIIISLDFLLIHLMPGDPVMHILGEDEYYTLSAQFPEKLEEVRRQYSLDGSLFQQYLSFLGNVVALQFGHSYITGANVAETVLFRMKWTALLSVCAIAVSAVVGGVLGVLAGNRKGGRLDGILTAFFLFLETIPANCLALIVLIIFSYRLKLFPVGGMASGGLSGLGKVFSVMHHMVLPAGVLSLLRTSSNFLQMKSFVSQIRDEEYMVVAVAKGLPQRSVIFRHLMKNAMVPYVTTLCLQAGHILSGAMLIEVVFSWKGMGTLIYDAVMVRDFPTVQMCFLMIAICVIVFNFIADLLCVYLDPRIQDGVRNA